MKKFRSALILFFTLVFIICSFSSKISAKAFNASEIINSNSVSSSPKALNDLITRLQKYGVKISITSGNSDTTSQSNTTSKKAPTVNTTAKPVNTTAKPANTTAKPVNTTAKPVNTTAKPVNTTAKPVNTTAKPVNTTSAPVNTTSVPVDTTEAAVVQDPQPENTNYVALTFDDGPSSSLTPRLLDALDEYNAKATFFLVGNMIRSDDVVKRIYNSGHEIGNHTYDHKDLTTLSYDAINNEIEQTSDIIRSITGANPTLLRPPYGAHNSYVDNIIGQYNFPIIFWNVDPEDWKYRDSDLVYEKVKNGLVDGNIILMHDIHATTVEAAIRILRDYSNKGYKFVTVSQLASIKNTPLNPGQSYSNFR